MKTRLAKNNISEFRNSLRNALTNKDYLQANELISNAKKNYINNPEEAMPEKDVKEVVLDETSNACNGYEFNLRRRKNDSSLHGIAGKILAANQDSGLNLGDLITSSRDREIGVQSTPRSFLKSMKKF